MQVEYSKDRSNFCEAKLRQDDKNTRSMPNKTQRRIRIPRHFWRWLLVTAGVVIVLIIIVVPTVLTVTQSGDDDFAGTPSIALAELVSARFPRLIEL